MMHANLTSPPGAVSAIALPAQARGGMMKAKAALIGLALASGGCVNIQAPDKPIVIQLDINIRAEVLYALAEDAKNTIEENGDIF